MPKAKPKFVRLTVTLTYYGVGKTIKDAQQNAMNDFANEYSYDDLVQDSKQTFEDVKDIKDTTIDQTFVDFVLGDDYEEHDAESFLKESVGK
jgi:hypothetical protein